MAIKRKKIAKSKTNKKKIKLVKSSRKKILGFANKGSDLENIIRNTNSGKCFDYETSQELKEFIQNCF